MRNDGARASESRPRRAPRPSFIFWGHAGRRGAALTLALLVVLVQKPAFADVSLATSPDGYVGAWLVAALPAGTPLDVASLRPRSAGPLSDATKYIRWSIADGGIGSLDVARAAGKTTSHAVVAGSLVVDTPFHGWLLLSVDGAVVATVDGKVVFTRARPHARGLAWDPVPLELAPGAHPVVLELTRQNPAWMLDARVLARSDLSPSTDLRWTLPGATDADALRLADHLTRTVVFAGLGPRGYLPRVHVDFPRGAPLVPSLHPTITVGGASSHSVDLGAVPIEHGALPLERALDPVVIDDPAAATPLPVDVKVRVGALDRLTALRLDRGAPNAASRALALRDELRRAPLATLSDPGVVTATLEESIAGLGALSDAQAPAVVDARRRLDAFVDLVRAGKDPLHDAPGVRDLAFWSSLDGRPEPFLLHVPASYRRGTATRYPLVVVLHGLNGTPEHAMTEFLGSDSRNPHPGVDGFVLAPNGHGNAFYRGPGETDVMAVLDWVLRTYPIDADRVSITGISMGGTGAAELAFRYPARFSAAAALAGYHSYFVRRDVRGRPYRDWELAELTRWSPASFADNGRGLFLYVAQGTRDLPLVHSQVLAGRYRELGYPLHDEWPDSGHDVWRITWANASLFPTLAGKRRVTEPKRVTLKADSLRYADDRWAHLTELSNPGTPAKLDVDVAGPGDVRATTSGVDAFALDRPTSGVVGSGTVKVTIDGTPLAFGDDKTFSAHRTRSGWSAGPPPVDPRPRKIAGMEGPIRDAYAGPLAFVYGTMDPTQTAAAREVAEQFRARYSGDTEFPVVADTAVGSLVLTHSLFLVGSKDSNLVVRALDARLPLRIDGRAVRAGEQRIDGDAELGFACVFPNPKRPTLYVVAVEAVGVAGLYRALSLPNQLPDFVIFDSGVAPAAGQQILGDARVKAAGYFDEHWQLPAELADRVVQPGPEIRSMLRYGGAP